MTEAQEEFLNGAAEIVGTVGPLLAPQHAALISTIPHIVNGIKQIAKGEEPSDEQMQVMMTERDQIKQDAIDRINKTIG